MMCGQVMKLTWINMWITCSITYSYLASSRDVRPNWLTVHVSVSQHPTPTSWLGLPLNKFGKIFWDLMWNNPAMPSNIMVCIKCSLSLFFFLNLVTKLRKRHITIIHLPYTDRDISLCSQCMIENHLNKVHRCKIKLNSLSIVFFNCCFWIQHIKIQEQ